jgi:hypothetical protein
VLSYLAKPSRAAWGKGSTPFPLLLFRKEGDHQMEDLHDVLLKDIKIILDKAKVSLRENMDPECFERYVEEVHLPMLRIILAHNEQKILSLKAKLILG